MAFKSLVGASLLLAACVALGGCQNTPQRQTVNPGFAQKQGSTNPPLVPSTQAKDPYGSVAPANNAFSSGGIPTAAPTGTGSQYRSTAPAPFINPSGPGPAPAGFGTPNPTPPGLAPNGPASFDPPIAPPTNPGTSAAFPR